MTQRRFPGTEPGFIRLVLEHEGELGWTLRATEAQSRGFVTAAHSQEFTLLSWEEACDLAGQVLDGMAPKWGPSSD